MILPVGMNIGASSVTEPLVRRISTEAGNQMISLIVASESLTLLRKSTESTRTFITKEIPFVEQVKRMIF